MDTSRINPITLKTETPLSYGATWTYVLGKPREGVISGLSAFTAFVIYTVDQPGLGFVKGTMIENGREAVAPVELLEKIEAAFKA